jgi:hypothetical protein
MTIYKWLQMQELGFHHSRIFKYVPTWNISVNVLTDETILQWNKLATSGVVMASHSIFLTWRILLNILCNTTRSSLLVQLSYMYNYTVTMPYILARCHSTSISSSGSHAQIYG